MQKRERVAGVGGDTGGQRTVVAPRPRIIERQMPLTAISAQSAREKSIRHGHLTTLHI